ncbi:unnamed protein product [Microthlaspi erraticum]|uniref:F-box domain-containing protein n=1 Tax=Microthlaspi erraticum TaxID=1685480 RepID=A0A6D2JCA9_9BRAS|nr:unnamed protein product [Microthlaspi erraticum]CAA7040937.1 unnamed protein product [Microthlaspi erraticum]
MKKQKQCISGNNSTVCGSNESSFDLIPVDLFINNILSRLPVKSLAQCRCVSKLWSSIVRRPNYHLLFPIKSPATPKPRLLYALEKETKLLFFSSPQPPKPSVRYLPPTRHTSFSSEYCYEVKTYPPVNGLVCSQHIGNKCLWAVISNPITGEFVTTPKVTSKWPLSKERIHFGYDPIGKQFKVLLSTWFLGSHVSQVLTLGTGNLSWRNIECFILHHYYYKGEDEGICINGVLYYQVIIDKKRSILCFDVRSEEFSFINLDQVNQVIKATTIWERPLILIDHKGKLGAIDSDLSNLSNVWVLENAEEHKWFNMHQIQRPNIMKPPFFSAAMIGSGQLVFYLTIKPRRPFNIFYYNLESKIMTPVQVPEIDPVDFRKVRTFPNFVKDVKLM